MSLKDFPIQDLREFAARGMNHKARYVPIWTFLIAIELCKLIIEDNSICEQEEVLELKKFISTNFPQQIGFAETIEVLTNNGKEVKVALSWLQGGCSSETSINTMVPIHYQKITDILLNYIKQVNTDSIYFLLFDELDEGYKKGDKNLNLLLLALLRAVENTALQFSDSHIQYRPVLALRTDIFNSLEDNDLNKLDDYIIHLKWTQEYGSPYSLRDLVNARINASIHTANPMDPWGCVVYDSDPALPRRVETLWKYVYNQTFERPRDIIKYMKYCSKELKTPGVLTYATVQKAEANYSQWFYREFRDEAQSFLPIYNDVLQAITNVGKGRFTFEEICEKFNENTNIQTYMTDNKVNQKEILEYLFHVGVIGTYDDRNKKWLFYYKDDDLPFDVAKEMIVHYGFAKKLRIHY